MDKGLKNICVNCEYYSPMGSEIEGACRVIQGDKPGQRGKKLRFDTNASQCSKWEPLAFVYTDTAHSLNIRTRTLGEYEEVKSDRLVYERHQREQEENREMT